MDQMANMANFTKLVEAGSFSAAAREMQVSSRRARHQVDPGAGKPALRFPTGQNIVFDGGSFPG